MKVLIQSNKFQKIAAEVARYSFIRQGISDVEIINLEEHDILVKNFGKKYLRNGKLTTFDNNDLQSFTLLRFIPTKLKINDYCLIVDPDIFAIKNPISEINKILDNKTDIYCTKINDKLRTEVMILNLKNNIWHFDSLIDDLFNKRIDYSDLMNLKFINNKRIKIIDSKFNDHDKINENTIFLHTSNRLTQPWKEGLEINFKNHFSKIYIIKNYIKFIIGKKYDEKIISNKFVRHPDENIIKIVKNLFEEAYKNNFININKIKFALFNKSISQKFFSSLEIDY
jgi:hypothetical protein